MFINFAIFILNYKEELHEYEIFLAIDLLKNIKKAKGLTLKVQILSFIAFYNIKVLITFKKW